MRPIPLIRAAGALLAANCLRRIGAPAESLWVRSGLPKRAFSEPESLVPLHLVVRFFEESSRVEGVDTLGLLVGEQCDVTSLGVYGTKIAQSPTLYDAIGTGIQLQPGWNSAVQFVLVPDGESVRLLRLVRGDLPDSPQFDLAALTIMIKLVRSAAGPQWRPSEIYLRGSGKARHVEALAESRIVWARRAIGFCFPRVFLSRPLGPGCAQTASKSSLLDETAWWSSSPPVDLAGSVRVLIESVLDTRNVTIAAAADAAAMSVRTLQRRLTESNLSYSSLIDQVRLARAIRLLEEPMVTISGIAFDLGFSDPAHFTRAFKRWSSVSPREYRRQRLIEQKAASVKMSGNSYVHLR
jgi:AraC-like DNA-binding protein